MRPASLLARARGLGLHVAEEDGRLRVEGEALTEELVAEFLAAKAQMLALLHREAERVTPCPCGECREPGAVQHGPRCLCGPCLDLDPEVEELRAKIAAEDAERKADAEYEAEDRLAIQAEGCTPAELEALRAAKSATADAVETGAHEQHEPGPQCHPPGPWSWTDPENAPGDVAILRAIERLDREESREAEEPSCYGCGGRDWWRARIGGHLVCRRCHPPAPGAEATP